MKAADCIIGVDAGSSVVKAVAFDLEGNELGLHELPSRLKRPHPLWVEQDMQELWTDVKTCVGGVARAIRNSGGKVLGLGLTSTGDGTWMIDRQGRPVRNGILWCDGRAGDIVERWHATGRAESAFAICGTSVFTGSQAVQLAWLRKNEPASLKRAAVIFHAKDWLFYRLTGQLATDETDESLTMLRMSTRQYDAELFKILGLDDLFEKYPSCRPTEENTGTLLPELARELHLPKDLPVGAGPMDVAACALGSGAVEHGEASSILGTAGIHQVVMNRPLLKPKMVGMTLCHGVKERWIRMIAAMVATPSLDWFLKEFGQSFAGHRASSGANDYHYLERLMQTVPAGSDGVMFHPYLFPGGERGPFVKPTARASFTGLSLNHSRQHLLRAVYEGVAFSMLDCYRHMPIEPARIHLSGGGTRSPFWCQLIADCLGKPVLVPAGSQFGAKGAALNLGCALGVYRTARQAVKRTVQLADSFQPNSKNAQTYSRLYAVYRATYESQGRVWDLRNQLLAPK